MAKLRPAVGSLFSAVKAGGDTITSVLDVANDSVSMLSTYVRASSYKQQRRLEDELKTFDTDLRNETIQRQVESDLNVLDFISKSEQHRTLWAKYEQAYKSEDKS